MKQGTPITQKKSKKALREIVGGGGAEAQTNQQNILQAAIEYDSDGDSDDIFIAFMGLQATPPE